MFGIAFAFFIDEDFRGSLLFSALHSVVDGVGICMDVGMGCLGGAYCLLACWCRYRCERFAISNRLFPSSISLQRHSIVLCSFKVGEIIVDWYQSYHIRPTKRISKHALKPLFDPNTIT